MERKNFCTVVNADSNGFYLKQNDASMMLGSCFTEHIGLRLQENKFNVLVNPFGVLYNPMSIFTVLRFLMRPEDKANSDDLIFSDGELWHSWLHSSDFSGASREELLRQVDDSVNAGCESLRNLDVLFLTFGNNHAYYLRGTDTVVANCHKQEPSKFDERRLSMDEIVNEGQAVLGELFRIRPDLHVVFSVSPYRYAKYGYHESQLGKATLLLAVDRLLQFCGSKGHYFPAFELMNDELRDYRFYSDDMLHPSALAVEYIWQVFLQNWVEPSAASFVGEWKNVLQALNHRPFRTDTTSYDDFLNKLEQKIEGFRKKYPNFAFEKELCALRAKRKVHRNKN